MGHNRVAVRYVCSNVWNNFAIVAMQPIHLVGAIYRLGGITTVN